MCAHSQKGQHGGPKQGFELHTTVVDWGRVIRPSPARWKMRRPAPACAAPPVVPAGRFHHPAQRPPSQTGIPAQSLPITLITSPTPTPTSTGGKASFPRSRQNRHCQPSIGREHRPRQRKASFAQLPGWCRAHSHLFLETDFLKHAQCRVQLAKKQGEGVEEEERFSRRRNEDHASGCPTLESSCR